MSAVMTMTEMTAFAPFPTGESRIFFFFFFGGFLDPSISQSVSNSSSSRQSNCCCVKSSSVLKASKSHAFRMISRWLKIGYFQPRTL